MHKKWTLFAVILVLGFGFAVESQAEQKEQPKTGGILIFGLGKEFANPHPFIATSSVFQFVKETCYESLLTQDHEGRIVPNLATSYEVSAGGAAFAIRLRKGVKFHNGQEMKADDVVWSANHVRNPKNGAFGNNTIKDVKSVEKIDEYAVKFTIARPTLTFLSHLCNIRMLPIVPANSLQPGQTRLEKNAFVPGTGPFLFEQYQPGFDTVVKKFPAYWGGPAYVEKIVFRPIADDANRFNALRAGDVHLADRLSPLDIDRVNKKVVKGINILEESLGGFRHITFNRDNPLFQKLEMRQAMFYALDKQRLIDEAFYGAAVPTELIMDPQGIWSKTANLPPHKRDLAKAKALLKAAGYNGQELVTIGRRQDAQLHESFQRMFGEAGIKVKVEILEAGVRKDRINAGKYDFIADGANTTSDPVITMMPDYYTNKTVKGRFSNQKVDRLFDSLDQEFDENKRLKIFRELAWTLYNEVEDIPLFFEIRYVGMSERVQGFGPPPGYSYMDTGNYFKHAWLK